MKDKMNKILNYLTYPEIEKRRFNRFKILEQRIKKLDEQHFNYEYIKSVSEFEHKKRVFSTIVMTIVFAIFSVLITISKTSILNFITILTQENNDQSITIYKYGLIVVILLIVFVFVILFIILNSLLRELKLLNGKIKLFEIHKPNKELKVKE